MRDGSDEVDRGGRRPAQAIAERSQCAEVREPLKLQVRID